MAKIPTVDFPATDPVLGTRLPTDKDDTFDFVIGLSREGFEKVLIEKELNFTYDFREWKIPIRIILYASESRNQALERLEQFTLNTDTAKPNSQIVEDDDE